MVCVLGPPSSARFDLEQALLGLGLGIQVYSDFELARLDPSALAIVVFDGSTATDAALAACRMAANLPTLRALPRVLVVPVTARALAYASEPDDVLFSPVVATEVRRRVGPCLRQACCPRVCRHPDERAQLEAERRLHAALVSTIEAIGRAMDKRDPYTSHHQARVAELAVAIGQRLRLPPDQLEGLRLGASIHDIGKIYVPLDLLNRPRRLSPVEYALVREHAVVGVDIVGGIEFPWPVAEMIRQHHERWDGSGYPEGIAGPEMVLEARIIAVADVVEAMASHRPYRPALGLNAALTEIRKNRGRLYDPAVVDSCLTAFDEGFVWHDGF